MENKDKDRLTKKSVNNNYIIGGDKNVVISRNGEYSFPPTETTEPHLVPARANTTGNKPYVNLIIADYKKIEMGLTDDLLENSNQTQHNVVKIDVQPPPLPLNFENSTYSPTSDSEDSELTSWFPIARFVVVGIVAAAVTWIILLASITLLPGLEAELAQTGTLASVSNGVKLAILYGIIFIATLYISLAPKLLDIKYGPPPIELEEFTPKPVDAYAFLSNLEAIKAEYDSVLDINNRIQISTMSVLQKNRATEMMVLVEEVIDTTRSLYQLNKITDENTHAISDKIKGFKDGMIELIEKQADKLTSKFDNINMPDTYEKEDELERLRSRGAKLLAKIENDSAFDGSEDKFRLGKIVYSRLDELWRGYITAKKDYYEEDNSGSLKVGRSTESNPDVIIEKIFADINNIYNGIDTGVNSVKKTAAMNELLSNKNYFEQL